MSCIGLLGLDTEYELNQINPNSATVRWRHSSGPGRNTATAIVAVRSRFPGRPGEPPFPRLRCFYLRPVLTHSGRVRMYQPHPRNIGINKRTSHCQCDEFRSQQLSGIGNNGIPVWHGRCKYLTTPTPTPFSRCRMQDIYPAAGSSPVRNETGVWQTTPAPTTPT
jgi:hypothetical protein